jgi:hypothetical protein
LFLCCTSVAQLTSFRGSGIFVSWCEERAYDDCRFGSLSCGLQRQWSVHVTRWAQRAPGDDGLEEVTTDDGVSGHYMRSSFHLFLASVPFTDS